MGTQRIFVGVDMGGTKIAAALLQERLPKASEADPAGASLRAPVVLDRVTVLTDQSSAEACLRGLLECIGGLLDGAAVTIAGVGIGVASTVDFAGGRVVASVNLPLNDVPLRDVVQQRFGVPVAVDNDATVAAIGEHAFGAGAGTRDMLMLTLGTGVGGGIICDGRPYRGHSGAAGELGHIVVEIDGLKCPANCPNYGCLEAYVAGPALSAAALAEARAKPHSALGRALAAGQAVDSRLLGRLAAEGDAEARALLARRGEYLGAAFTTLVNIFNPELIVVGGGVAAVGEPLLGPARRVLAERALQPGRGQVRVVPSAFGPDAGFFGAAALAMTELAGGASRQRS
jgi:glucokinase